MKNKHEGNVFDIHRFSLNDGPGIRTTVFLKGCPLKCLWCHNPESQAFKPQLSFNLEKCLHCFNCVDACQNSVHKIIEEKHQVFFEECKLAGNCIDACTQDALKIIGQKRSVEEIISEVKKDKKYYDKSGGGITISGGEPMAQYELTKQILKAAKKEGLHTCLDTCGFAKQRQYEELLEYVDLFLFDYKATDSQKHIELTGVDNKLILHNLNFLYNKKAHLIIRCLIVPGINDDSEHTNRICELKNEYPNAEIEILKYHKMGIPKLAQLGMTI